MFQDWAEHLQQSVGASGPEELQLWPGPRHQVSQTGEPLHLHQGKLWPGVALLRPWAGHGGQCNGSHTGKSDG